MGDTARDDAALEAVRRYARAIASRDAALIQRGDVSPDDVAQDVVLQYHRLAAPPDDWKAWTSVATRHRLVDLVRARRDVPSLDEVLVARAERRMGPSAGVMARDQIFRAISGLSEKEKAVLAAHLVGATNAQIAETHGYANGPVVATLIARIRARIRQANPGMAEDLEAVRPY